MSGKVYANGREVSAKKDANKTMGAMPDVCLSPPAPPAGPIPIPYPNFSQGSDTSAGTKKVMIKGKEVGKKNSSNYKKSKGDTPATRNFGMGTVTHTLEGKMYHAAWSFNVKFENENAIRHMDMTTHNHGSTPPDSLCSGMNQAGQESDEADPECEELEKQNDRMRANKVDPNYKGGYTMTTSFFTPPGRGTSFRAAVSSPKCLKNKNDTAFAPSNSKSTMGCSSSEYGAGSPRQSAVNINMARNHAEPKLMEPIFVAAGSPTSPRALGTLTMKTFHKEKSGAVDSMPCETCRPAICTAVACGLEIKLCNDKNKAVDPPCQNGQPAPADQWQARGLGAY